MNSYLKISLFILGIVAAGCEKPETTVTIETPDWTPATHGSSTPPDYAIVLPQDKVQRLDLTISSANWADIQSDLAGMPRSGPGQPLDGTYDPIWVECDVHFNGIQWYKAGIRVKGNSSLRTTYQRGIKKYSFKLDFDQWEETYPAIKDQRFYGFKQLNLNNNFDDQSLMREKVAGDLFREFGVPAARSAFYEVYIDNGSGSQYFGLYTLVEEVDNTVISTQFINNSGNLYKPEGNAASFAAGSWDTTEFFKKTNTSNGDYSDIRALYDAVNDGSRTADPASWRTLMNSKINMSLYLKWLAANSVMQNWDTYGRMTHNFYLYNDPAQSKLVWIPWDNNEALQEGKQGGAINLDLSGVTGNWPMISYIAADAVYYAEYKQYAREFASTVFAQSKMTTTYESISNLIRESGIKEVSGYTFISGGASGFDSAVRNLKSHVAVRNAAAAKLN